MLNPDASKESVGVSLVVTIRPLGLHRRTIFTKWYLTEPCSGIERLEDQQFFDLKLILVFDAVLILPVSVP